MVVVVQFLLGLLFGVGLIVAGMSDPAKVLGFLDVGAIPLGGWDPSLAFVLVAATATTFVGYRIVLRRPRPVLDGRFHLPRKTAVDAPVVVGPAIFGVGWGLVGLCPGPALVALGTGRGDVALFVAAMFAGMVAARRLALRSLGPAAQPT